MEEETETTFISPISPPRSPSHDNREDLSELTSEAPPNYNDVVSGKSPSIRVKGADQPPQNLALHSAFNSRSNTQPTISESQNSNQQHSSNRRGGMRRTKSANRSSRNQQQQQQMQRSNSCMNPERPWQQQQMRSQSNNAPPSEMLEMGTRDTPGGRVESSGETVERQPLHNHIKCFIALSTIVCPFWLGVCIYLSVIAGLNWPCVVSLHITVEAGMFVGIGIISFTMSVLVALCLKARSDLLLRMGFIVWWLIWVITAAVIGVTIYFGWTDIIQNAFFFKSPGCNDLVIYTAFGGLVMAMSLGVVLLVLILMFCCVGFCLSCSGSRF